MMGYSLIVCNSWSIVDEKALNIGSVLSRSLVINERSELYTTIDEANLDSDLFLTGAMYEKVATDYSAEYKHSSPFAHIVLDQLFPDEVMQAVANEFPKDHQHLRDNGNELHYGWKSTNDDLNQLNKFYLSEDDKMLSATKVILGHLRSSSFIFFLEKLTGIENLFTDARMVGAGLHQTLRGGYLALHRDFNYHQDIGLYRRVNVFVYLNEDWLDEYFGHLDLYDEVLSVRGRHISPKMNRVVIFSSSPYTYHGHPKRLACPVGRSRNSIAMYYYTLEPGPADLSWVEVNAAWVGNKDFNATMEFLS